jgi:hypothetical protein
MPSKRKADNNAEAPPAKALKIDGIEFLQASLKAVYGMEFPGEMFLIWEVACEACAEDPLNAFKAFGVRLVGPFEILAAKEFAEGSKPHIHWRFPYDPPEFMTLMVGPDRHWGYFRDDPAEMPVLVASGKTDSHAFIVEDHLLVSALCKICTPTGKKNTGPSALAEALQKKMDLHGLKRGDAAKTYTARNRQSIGAPFHKMGLVVPYDTKTEVGYRDLGRTPAEFKSMLEKVSGKGPVSQSLRNEFDTLLTFVDVANDECDFGHGLEVGLDLFCFASLDGAAKCELHAHCLRILDMAYMLLNRSLYQQIINDHMGCRNRAELAERMD